MIKNQTIKQFLKGTKNNYIVEITKNNNKHIIFNDIYGIFKEKRKDLFNKIVLSYDITECYDEKAEKDYIIIGIMI